MDPMENMRNCVAPNRRPGKSVIENYDAAIPLLDDLLNQYLARWEVQSIDSIENPSLLGVAKKFRCNPQSA